MNKEELSHTLKTIRKVKGLSQKELSIKSGVSNSQISDIEKGRSMPSVEHLSTLLKALGWRLSIEPEENHRIKDIIDQYEKLHIGIAQIYLQAGRLLSDKKQVVINELPAKPA